MSHAMGEVIKDGKTVGYYEYNGTCDFATTKIRPTVQEVWDHWRKSDIFGECTCGQPSEDVLLYTNYGYGYYWPGKACMDCMVIVDGTDPYGDKPEGWGDPMDPKRGHPIHGIDPDDTIEDWD
jgi:hypothetical protein